MPRIATALGVWIAVIVAIGFNIVRYPIVWEMVAVSVPEPATERVAATSAPSAPPKAPVVEKKAPREKSKPTEDRKAHRKETSVAKKASKPKVVCDGKSCTLASDDKSESHKAIARPDVTVTAKTAAVVEPTPSEPPKLKVSAGDLLDDALVTAPGEDAPANDNVRRLPPLTEEQAPSTTEISSLPNASIPLYASTGVQ